MNEKRKSYNDWMNQSKSDTKLNARDLYAAVYGFRAKPAIKYGDWKLLTKLLNQLKNENLPKKILRRIQSNFNEVQNNYQR